MHLAIPVNCEGHFYAVHTPIHTARQRQRLPSNPRFHD